jgi:SAM-dependent methyltransferase
MIGSGASVMPITVAQRRRLHSAVMWQPAPELAGHPDRLKWNARYSGEFTPLFAAHPLAVHALSLPLPNGPVLELAAGPSGSALLAAANGKAVTAVDASDVALRLLGEEAEHRGLGALVTLVHADLEQWVPDAGAYALVLATGYWERAVFAAAAQAVAPGGLIAWEALTEQARAVRRQLPAEWCVTAGEPASLLPAEYAVIDQSDVADAPVPRRRLLARRS